MIFVFFYFCYCRQLPFAGIDDKDLSIPILPSSISASNIPNFAFALLNNAAKNALLV